MVGVEEYLRAIEAWSIDRKQRYGGGGAGESGGSADNGSLSTAPEARRLRSRLHSLAFLLVHLLTPSFRYYYVLSFVFYSFFSPTKTMLFSKSSECRSKHDTPSLFPHSRGILHALKHQNIPAAIASKSPTPDIATTYLNKLGIRSMFVAEVCCFSLPLFNVVVSVFI